jgi:hypothetical protein
MKNSVTLLLSSLLVIYACSCKNVATYPISEPSDECVQDWITGKWKFREDTDRNNFYEVSKLTGKDKNKYHIQAWNWASPAPTYETDFYFSKIDGSLFVNIAYVAFGKEKQGFGFLKVSDINPGLDKLTLDCINDTTMQSLRSSADVMAHLTKNIANPAFYHSSLHFFKVK